MRSPIGLYEFMPYGAPELLEASRRHLVRAVAAGSAFWIACFLLAVGLGMTLGRHPHEQVVRVPPIIDLVPPLIELDRIPFADAPAPPVAPARDGAPLPVPDPPVPIELPPTHGNTTGPVDPTAREGTNPVVPIAPTVERLPGRDEFVPVDEPPYAITSVKPEYPDIARQAGVEGKLVVRVLVGKNGRVVDAYVVPGTSIPMLDEAALTAARRWVFTPALAANHPVAVWVAIPIWFRLH